MSPWALALLGSLGAAPAPPPPDAPPPAEKPRYDEVGYAAVMGAPRGGDDRAAMIARDPSLIAARYAEITNLDTGRIILLRVGADGSAPKGDLVALSPAAARLLDGNGDRLRVRVRPIAPSDEDRAALDAGRPAAPRLDAPKQLLAALNARFPDKRAPERAGGAPPPVPVPPAPAPKQPAPRPSVPPRPAAPPRGGVYVQIAALSDRARADKLAAALRDVGPAGVAPAGKLYRVRIGPLSPADAASALARARGRGYRDAHVVRDSP